MKQTSCDFCNRPAYLVQTGVTVDSLLEYRWSKYHCPLCGRATYRIDDVRWQDAN